MQCYTKNATWAGCREQCELSDWSCGKLGPRTPVWTTMTTTTRTTTIMTFFCLSVLRESGYEHKVLQAQLQNRIGIAACDEFALLSSDNFTIEGVRTIYFHSAPVGVSDMGFAANIKLFVNVWDSVKRDGRFQLFDWTLKVDPDAVLIPERLRGHLGPYNGHKAYVADCNGHMYGAVEAISRRALETYYERIDICAQYMWKNWGEDLYMEKCLDKLGVEKVMDGALVSDSRCGGVNCQDLHAVAFHPFKSKDEWEACWATASKNESEVHPQVPEKSSFRGEVGALAAAL
mmetsp:Transcript_79801/g.205277  ORF Transcript_79801/g.205277 Transcript_79801/m.205277 type:complete len:289 (+) Transcript_79801:3-869(+)